MTTEAFSPSTRSPSHTERQSATQQLLADAALADRERRELLLTRVVELNLRVAHAVARRYDNRGVDLEDLEQAASEGLVKAVHRYDPAQQHDLLSFAVPTIRGEVLRYFRDRSWSVRPPRRVQELQLRLRQTASRLASAQGREPTPRELRDAVGASVVDQREADAALGCFQPTSLDQPPEPGSPTSLGESLADEGDGYAPAEARVALHRVAHRLEDRERRVIFLRFFEGRTQQEIGAEFDVTQATVSRWLAETLDKLRVLLGPAEEKAA